MDKDNQAVKNTEKKHHGVFKTIVDLAFISFCAGLPTFYLFIGNITEIGFTQLIMPLLVFSAIGWIPYLVLRLILRKSSVKAGMLSGIFVVVVMNAGTITGALGYAAALAISAAIIAALFFVIIRFASGHITEKIEFILAGVMAALILFNVVISIPKFASLDQRATAAAAKTESIKELEKIEVPAKYAGGNADLPNVYMFFFDELAGTECMKEVFDYDNTWFYNDMRKLGFNVAAKTTNYRHFTYESLAGLFNLDYVYTYDEYGTFACKDQFLNSRIFNLMQGMGYGMYETETTGKTPFLPRIDYGMSKAYSKAEDGTNTIDIILGGTLLGPLVKDIGVFPTDYELYNKIFDYYTRPESYTYKKAFTFSAMACPHAPFYFDKDGNPVDDAHRMDWTDSKYFLGQYEYICKRILTSMKGVIENDPNAIIIVFSDHGLKMNKALWNGPQTNEEQATDTFFAAYTGGRDDLGNIDGLSGADILRTLLNKEYGFNLDMVGAPDDLS